MSVTISLDFETADNGADSACALGLARIDDGQVTSSWYSLIRPPRQRMLYTWVHGITLEDVRDAPTFAEVWPDVATFMADADNLVAHNAGFDRRVLLACCAAAGVMPPSQPFLCTLKGARKLLRLPSHKLDALCQHFSIALTHHHAESDALAAAHVLVRLRELGLEDALMRLK